MLRGSDILGSTPAELGYSRSVPLDPAIKSLIAQFRRSPQWDEHLDLELLQKLWPALVGEQLAGATRITAIHGSTAVLDVPDLVWRKQLYRLKATLLSRMNELWGSQRITEIAITYENH
jgi:predicted nucleic acid-binding Zn ribbon protein